MEAANTKLIDLICARLKRKPGSITHGEFNRMMFLDAMIFVAGTGVSISADDIKEHCNMTDKEFKEVEAEYLKEGAIVKVANPFGESFYKLNMTIKSIVDETVAPTGALDTPDEAC